MNVKWRTKRNGSVKKKENEVETSQKKPNTFFMHMKIGRGTKSSYFLGFQLPVARALYGISELKFPCNSQYMLIELWPINQ